MVCLRWILTLRDIGDRAIRDDINYCSADVCAMHTPYYARDTETQTQTPCRARAKAEVGRNMDVCRSHVLCA